MASNGVVTSSADLMHQWRRQIGHRHRVAAERGPRPFAVMSHLVRGSVADDEFVALRRVTLVTLFDERLASGELATRLVGIGGTTTADGIRFGGPELSRFDKDLRLPPTAGGRGPRLDTADGGLLSFALALERYLERCARHPYFPRRQRPSLPNVANHAEKLRDSLVEFGSLPKRQIVSLDSPVRDLCGQCETTAFDFYHTRFHVAP